MNPEIPEYLFDPTLLPFRTAGEKFRCGSIYCAGYIEPGTPVYWAPEAQAWWHDPTPGIPHLIEWPKGDLVEVDDEERKIIVLRQKAFRRPQPLAVGETGRPSSVREPRQRESSVRPLISSADPSIFIA